MSVLNSRKLLEKLQVVFEEQAQIIDAIAQHRETVDSHAEGIALPAFAVDAGSLENVRMNHPAPQYFQPAGLFANTAALAVAENTLDIGFGRRLGKGEVRRPQPHAERPLEKTLEEGMQHGFQVREADALADHHSFDLVKHGRMRHVRIDAIHAARCDDGQWRRL